MQPIVDDTEVAVRRRLVRHALAAFLSEEQLQQALELWEREFAQQADFLLFSYVVQLHSVLDLAEQREALTQQLLQCPFLRSTERASGGASSRRMGASRP